MSLRHGQDLAAALLAIAALTVSCSTPRERVQRIGQYEIEVPPGVKALREEPVADFQVFRFLRSKSCILNAYLGPHPSWPEQECLAFTIAAGERGLQRIDVGGVNTNGMGFRNFLACKLPGGKYPIYLHFWYTNNTATDARIADDLIDSVGQRARFMSANGRSDSR